MVTLVLSVRRFKKLVVPVGALVLLLLLVSYNGSCGNLGHTGGVPVQISEHDFRITSSLKTFTHGVRYHFVSKNNGRSAHKFIVSETPSIFNMAFSR